MMPRKTTLDVFIPEDRRQALTQGDSLPTQTHGAVMFADISGFTRLTAIFSRELGSQRGAEALTQLLDPIYAGLVNSIHNFRGSVIVISGDGITCWFDQDDGRRATASAFAMQKIVAQYATMSILGGRKVNLGIKIALSVGAVQRLLVGNPAIQLLETVVGREVDQVVSVHESLKKGDVAIGIDLLNKFGDSVSVLAHRHTAEGALFALVEEKSKLAEPDPWPKIPALDDKVARKWVYQSVYSRIEGEEIEFLTELRQVVPLFVKFTGIDYDQDEKAAEKLDRFVRCVQSILEQYEGYLCQLTIGGKGTNAFIAFGAPIAHEDNVDRALAAALRLKEETARLGFIQPIQIGLTRGQLWAGAHGGGAARTYSVIGLDVNLAHRLMSHTEPGQILVSPHVAETAPNYSFVPLSLIDLKGIEKPMTPYMLLGRARVHGEFSDRDMIFGRATERGILSLKLLELISGGKTEPAGMVLIEGEAGIGKSRLLADFMEQADQQGVRVLYGEADPVESGTQFYAFRRVLESIFDISEVGDSQIAKNMILDVIRHNQFLLDRAPLLSEILPLQWQDNELTSQMSGESRAENIKELVLGILKSALTAPETHAPTVIILDDAHWLDYATWKLVDYIARQLPTLLFVISMRPFAHEESGSQTAQAYLQLRANPATQQIQLSSLAVVDMARLIEQRLGVKTLPAFVLEFIRARSHGNPFFTEEVAYALRDAGIIRIEDGDVVVGYAADELHRIDFPATVQGVITSRIDRLSPSQQLTLKVASVIGRVFLLKILNTVHPSKIGMNVLLDQLTVLTSQGITDPDVSSPENSYLFRHVITQEVIYGLLTFAQRKQLHCEIAEWYEHNHLGDQSSYYSRLAHHWLNGEALEKAIFFLDKAGEQALELFSNEDVIRFTSTAIELDERMHGKVFDLKRAPERMIQRARWERMLGTANLKLGRLADSLKHYKNALRMLGHPVPETSVQIGLNLLKEILIQTTHRIRGNARQDQEDSLDRQIYTELAQIGVGGALFYAQNAPQLAWSFLFRLNVAERAGSPHETAAAYIGLLLIATFVQNKRLLNMYRRLAWQAVEQADRTNLRIQLHLMDGVASYICCEWDRANELFRTGVQMAEQIGDLREFASLAGAWTGSIFLQGKYEECISVWMGVYDKLARKDIHQNLAWATFGQGLGLLMLGQLESAMPKIETALTMLKKSAGDTILTTFTYGALSLGYLRQEQYDRALEHILAHEQKARAPSASSILFYYSPVIDSTLGLYEGVLTGKIHFKDSDAAQVKRLAARIPNFLKAMKNLPVNKTGVWLYQGIYNGLTGKHQHAIAAWRRSIEFAQRFDQPYELARASLELGQHASLDAITRRKYLEEAYTGFERLKTPYELDLALSALARLTTASMG
jgi:class 3 adenylate cyclase/tetratricopeptide (TPR) repeat protein